jgi:hypothetical protein
MSPLGSSSRVFASRSFSADLNSNVPTLRIFSNAKRSVGDPDPVPDPDPLVKGMDPDPHQNVTDRQDWPKGISVKKCQKEPSNLRCFFMKNARTTYKSEFESCFFKVGNIKAFYGTTS